MSKARVGPVVEVKIEEIGGECPVQAEGTVNGKPFYFRARHSQWSISISRGDGSPEWTWQEPYGKGPFDAGYMPVNEAFGFIMQAATRFVDDHE